MTDAEIDIYGETLDFKAETKEENGNEVNNEDLYDDAVLASGTADGDAEALTAEAEEAILHESSTGGMPATHSSGLGLAPNQPGRKYLCYMGNMTWWTTDKDVADAVQSLGITDMVDLKFYENRANGQSKGFALLCFLSDASVRTCMDKLPARELHGQHPVVLPYTRNSLAQFETATKRVEAPAGGGGGRRRDEAEVPPEAKGAKFLGTVRIGPTTMASGGAGGAPNQQSGGMQRPPMVFPPGMPMPMGVPMAMPGGARPPMNMFMPGPPPPGFGGSAAAAAAAQQQIQMMFGAARPGMLGGGGPPQIVIQRPPGMMLPQQPMQQQQQVPQQQPQQQLPQMQQQQQMQPMHRPVMPTGVPPPAGQAVGGSLPPGAPAPHINPNFYPNAAAAAAAIQQAQAQAHQQQGAPMGYGPPQGMQQHHHQGLPPQQHVEISEAEFDEIMNRNKTVSSSAISRAVSDAAAGEYASAIETLVTAISLIRQSKVASDDRCKILVSSLQDTLHGIEAKSYGGGAQIVASRPKRERSRSPRERAEGGRRKRRERSPRSRSRSRERYRDEYSPPAGGGGGGRVRHRY